MLMISLPGFPPSESLLRSGKSSDTDPCSKSKLGSYQQQQQQHLVPITRGPGWYTVVKCGASGHNIRSNPSLAASPIGMLILGDMVNIVNIKEEPTGKDPF